MEHWSLGGASGLIVLVCSALMGGSVSTRLHRESSMIRASSIGPDAHCHYCVATSGFCFTEYVQVESLASLVNARREL